jgi:hypothetical protein
MSKLIVGILLVSVVGVIYAHALNQYQSKSFEFHRQGHIVDVQILTDNVLHVYMDTVEIGSRTNFCTPK